MGEFPRKTRDIIRDDRHRVCRDVEDRLREANRRLQAEGPALERDKLIMQLRDKIASLEEQLKAAKNDVKDHRVESKEEDRLRTRLGELLTGVAVALRGPQPRFVRYDWSGLPTLVAQELETAYTIGLTDGFCLHGKSGPSDAHVQRGLRDYHDARLDRLKILPR